MVARSLAGDQVGATGPGGDIPLARADVMRRRQRAGDTAAAPHRHPAMPKVIHTAIAIIIRFSVSDRKPSGTLLDPPTQAHFNARPSI